MLRPDRAQNLHALEAVRKASIELLVKAPLMGLTLLGTAISVEEHSAVETMATDGHRILYSAAWVLGKPLNSIMFDLLHELAHVLHNHVLRRGPVRDKKLWNTACDVRVAHDCLAILTNKGQKWELDKDYVPAFWWAADLTVEEIYERLLQDKSDPAVAHEQVSNAREDLREDLKEAEEASESAEARFKQQLVEDLAKAATAEEARGVDVRTTYGAALWQRIQELRRCDVPWNVLIQGRLCAALDQEHATWVPPNRRWFPKIPLPSRRASTADHLLLGIDVSGSITDEDIKRFRACVMPAARRAKRTTVITFDEIVRELHTSTRPEELFNRLAFATGSHTRTDVRPVFEFAETSHVTATAIITDGHLIYPDKPYPKTTWVLTPTAKKPPWGKIYTMSYSW